MIDIFPINNIWFTAAITVLAIITTIISLSGEIISSKIPGKAKITIRGKWFVVLSIFIVIITIGQGKNQGYE